MEKAEVDAYNKAGKLLSDANDEMQKGIDDYASGNDNSAARHYSDAMDSYDKALDLLN